MILTRSARKHSRGAKALAEGAPYCGCERISDSFRIYIDNRNDEDSNKHYFKLVMSREEATLIATQLAKYLEEKA